MGLRPPQMTEDMLAQVQADESGGLLAQAARLLASVLYDLSLIHI